MVICNIQINLEIIPWSSTSYHQSSYGVWKIDLKLAVFKTNPPPTFPCLMTPLPLHSFYTALPNPTHACPISSHSQILPRVETPDGQLSPTRVPSLVSQHMYFPDRHLPGCGSQRPLLPIYMVVQSPETLELRSFRLDQEFNSTGPPPQLVATKPDSYLILTKKESWSTEDISYSCPTVPIGEFHDLDRGIPAVENEKSMLNICNCSRLVAQEQGIGCTSQLFLPNTWIKSQ